MNKAKYIIVDGCAIVFSAAITHSDMAKGMKVESAGFVVFRPVKDEDDWIVKATAFGESISLGIKSREIDSDLITRQISNPYF